MSATGAVPSRGEARFRRSAGLGRRTAHSTAADRDWTALRSRPLLPARGTVYRSLPDGYQPTIAAGVATISTAHLVCAAGPEFIVVSPPLGL